MDTTVLKLQIYIMNHKIFDDDQVEKITLQSMNHAGDHFSDEELLNHLREPPSCTVVRVNTLIADQGSLKDDLISSLVTQYEGKGFINPSIELHPMLDDVLIIKSNQLCKKVQPEYSTAIVGVQCGVAILRGAQAYAPGVIALPNGLVVGDKVSVFADLKGQCKRGFTQKYLGPTYFVGNGILVQDRKDLFTIDVPKGIAINMVEPLFDCPSIGDILFDAKTGLQKGFLQNLPSIVCGHVLSVNEHHTVLDMCAAPGGKTTHIATLMRGKGTVLAIDKSTAKVKQIQANAEKLGLRNIKTFVFDSVKAVFDKEQAADIIREEPPFLKESFDRILLDAPCSALGQRPQLYNPIRCKELESFPRLQRKLFIAAAELLKVGGRMVYSTCTYNVAENEEIVSWALKKFPCLELLTSDLKLGQPGYHIDGLTLEHCNAMQRFGPSRQNHGHSDSIGFFLCSFEKKFHFELNQRN